MLGYTCLARKQLRRLAPLLLASIVTLIATVTEAEKYCGPQIVTYGEPCPLGHNPNLPYQVQTPLTSHSSQSPHLGPPGGKSYCYGISAPPSQWRPSNVGFELPVSVQQPVLPQNNQGPQGGDPFRGRSYGIGIQNGLSAPQNSPSLGSYDFGVQNSVPGPKYHPSLRDPSDRFNVQVQPVGGPYDGPYDPSGPRWGPLPISIERPAHDPRDWDGSGDGPPRRLTGLTSKIDRLLVPACDLPMCGSGSG